MRGSSGSAGLAVQAVFQDGFDALIGAGAKAQRACAGGFQPLRSRAFAQTNDAQAGAKTHFGMRLVGGGFARPLGRIGAGFARPVDQPTGRPFQVTLVGSWAGVPPAW